MVQIIFILVLKYSIETEEKSDAILQNCKILTFIESFVDLWIQLISNTLLILWITQFFP